MDDVTEPLPDSLTGRTSFGRAMAAELADNRPFDGFLDWDWDWLRQALSLAQIEEELTAAFERSSNPSHLLVFQVLNAAR